MMRRSRLVLAVAAAGVLCEARPAAAQEVPAAAALFEVGVKEMNAGHYEKACPAIAESRRLDPRPGTLFTLAECEAKRNRIATALTHYRDYLALYAKMTPAQRENHAKRAGIAQAQESSLAPQVPALAITLAANAPAGTTITLDDVTVPEAALGVGLPVDPGEHVVRTEAPGRPAREARVTLKKGESRALSVEVSAARAAAPPTPPPMTTPPASAGPSTMRVAAYAVGGVGIAGIALGGVMGGLTLMKKATIDQDCGVHGVPTDCRTAAGAQAGRSAQTTGLVSTIGFAAGGAALGTAVVLLVVDRSASKRSASAWPRPSVAADGSGLVIGASGVW